jgi:hypothetical protein
MPYFRITDWVEAEPIMRQFVELAAQDPSCTHYGWTGDGSGRVVWNSHVSKTDEALVDYMDRVKPLVSAMVEGVNGHAHLVATDQTKAILVC